MAAREIYRNKIELLQGTLDLLILETLRWGTQHGYAISQAIRARSGEVLQVETGSLYPALHRMERQKWIASEWRTTDQNQRAKFYKLTSEGRKQLARDRSKWETMVEAMGGVLNPQTEN
ncbi:MAG TPA: PadR family transcriptional regulator [Bryobacteraceae bacterium]|jgi:transcriptional regulator|nr:PadR family transcriptional regulator [Bryobacteraceae bacterium]